MNKGAMSMKKQTMIEFPGGGGGPVTQPLKGFCLNLHCWGGSGRSWEIYFL